MRSQFLVAVLLILLIPLLMVCLPREYHINLAFSPSLTSEQHYLAALHSDLDGDQSVDSIQLLNFGFNKKIVINFRNHQLDLNFNSGIASQGELFLVDLDQDNDLDLIWTVPNNANYNKIWYNNREDTFSLCKPNHSQLQLISLLNQNGEYDRLGSKRSITDPFLLEKDQTFPLSSHAIKLSVPPGTLLSLAQNANIFDSSVILKTYHNRAPPLV